jgi:DNA repair protein RecO (recombination protein O)
VRTLSTDALVLHTLDYRETSRIVRLVTRDAGVVSVVARGARRSKNRFGAALDLFATGAAQIVISPTRDLHALNAFEAAHGRPSLAASLDRFGAASALAELCMRFGRESETGNLFELIVGILDHVATAASEDVTAVAIAGAWRLVGEFGFAPALDQCALCHAPIPAGVDVTFNHRAGGALCDLCARQARGGRRLPAEARATLISWTAGEHAGVSRAESRSHLRLLREFLEEHMAEDRPMRALAAWEERQARTVEGDEA